MTFGWRRTAHMIAALSLAVVPVAVQRFLLINNKWLIFYTRASLFVPCWRNDGNTTIRWRGN
jgi:hypothetical protein